MPLLLTGASGRLGGLLRAAWAAAPPAGLAPLWQSRRARGQGWLAWDPADAAPLPAALAGGVMLHFAGPTPAGGGDLAMSAPLAVAGLEAARRAGVAHVILASSAAVYGRPVAEAPLSEETPLAPASAYSAAKTEMEAAALRWCDAAGAEAPGLTILRIGNVAGADALLSAARQARPNAPLVLDRFANGATPRRSYVGPRTLAHVLERLAHLARSDVALPEVINLAAPGPGVEMGALLEALAAAGREVPWRSRPAGPEALRAMVLDTARLSALVPLDELAGTAEALVGEWLAVEPAR